jgi:hypothetical protein
MEPIMSKTVRITSDSANANASTITKLAEQLKAWSRVSKASLVAMAENGELPVGRLLSTPEYKAKRGYNKAHSLHRYVAVVHFPLSRGGGSSLYKSKAAVMAAEAKGYRVEWISR